MRRWTTSSGSSLLSAAASSTAMNSGVTPRRDAKLPRHLTVFAGWGTPSGQGRLRDRGHQDAQHPPLANGIEIPEGNGQIGPLDRRRRCAGGAREAG